MRIWAAIASLMIYAGLLLVKCTPNLAGNISQTGNGMIAGVLYEPDGKCPANKASVCIRKINFLADTTTTLINRSSETIDTVFTDNQGKFVFNSIETGMYVIEGTDGKNNYVLYDSVPVKSKDSSIILTPDTLKPAGAIKGIINLSEGGDPRKVFVFIYGIDRFAHVNIDGSFKLLNLAESRYNLRLISSLDNYGVLDTGVISVIAAETTDVKTLELPFTGIQTPNNLTISYDTSMQIVKLSWNRPESGIVKSFNIYRINVDSNSISSVPINKFPVTDTTYSDSTGIQGQNYEYRVASVDKNTAEGTKSAAVKVFIASTFKPISEFNLSSSAWRIALKKDPNKRIYCYGSGFSVYIYDSVGNMINSFRITPAANDIATDENDNLYSIYNGDSLVKKWPADDTFSLNWKFSNFFEFNYLQLPQPRLEINRSMIFIYDEHQVLGYKTDSTFVFQNFLSQGQKFIFAKSADSIIVYDSLENSLKNLQQKTSIPLISLPVNTIVNSGKAIDDSTILLYTSSNNQGPVFYVLNSRNGSIKSRLQMEATDYDIGGDGKLYIIREANKVEIFEKQGW